MTQRVVNYTYGTGNPVLPDGSIDVRDGIDNLQSFDIFMNADEGTYNQRDGGIVPTVAGAIRSIGIPIIGNFTDGCTVTKSSEGVQVIGGSVYRWSGSLPKVVPPLSTPSGTGGISPSGDWVDVGDASLRSDLSQSSGVDLVGGAAKQSELNALSSSVSQNERRNVDTIAALRLTTPKGLGEIVYVRSSVATPVGVYGYFGGGYFAAYDNTQDNIDDGGVFVNSPHVTLDWQRINFTEYDMRFWGVITDLASFDNAPSITLATNFAKARKVLLHAPAGNIYTSEMVPVYNNMGITGQGGAEQTVFYKTTNNAFPYKANGNTVFTVDALVGFVPKKSIAGGSVVDGETHTARPHLSKCMFRRAGLTAANYATTRPTVGLFAGSMAGGLVSDVTLEGGYIGVQGWTCYLATMERLFVNNYPGKGFTAFTFSAYTAAPVGFKTSGTSLDMRLVNGRGYQIGFSMVGQQYTSMTCCTVEECEPMLGETNAIAFQFINPYSITMDACATELVKGTQISVTNAPPVSYKSSLIVKNYIAIGQRNPQEAGTKFIEIDNGGAGTMNVTFIGGDLTRDAGLANLVGGTVSGTGSKAIKIGAGGLVLTGVAGGVFTDLA